MKALTLLQNLSFKSLLYFRCLRRQQRKTGSNRSCSALLKWRIIREYEGAPIILKLAPTNLFRKRIQAILQYRP